MLFPLFSKVFTYILNIYDLPKRHNIIPKNCHELDLAIIIYHVPTASLVVELSLNYRDWKYALRHKGLF